MSDVRPTTDVLDRWSGRVGVIVFREQPDGTVTKETDWHPAILVSRELVEFEPFRGLADGRRMMERIGSALTIRITHDEATYRIIEEDALYLACELVQ